MISVKCENCKTEVFLLSGVQESKYMTISIIGEDHIALKCNHCGNVVFIYDKPYMQN